jgi:hypothetical protein
MSTPTGYRRRDREAYPPLDHPPYRSTQLRAPAQEPIPIDHTLSEVTGPGPALAAVKEGDADLTRNAGTDGEAIGERIIAEEAALDQLFADRSITPAALETATGRIAAEQGALRAAHLRYHLEMLQILSPAQIRRYAELRGYASPHGHN